MKVTGFTFIRNGIKFDYPVVEAITSILPICDEFVVLVGNSDDNTLDLIRAIGSEKIKIHESIWDDSLRVGGKVLAKETDKAFSKISEDTDWCFYIQGDEVVHEKYLPAVLEAMKKWKENPEVDGLLFKYNHFYGSYDYLGANSSWYRREIRVIKNNKNIYSYKDAQGFRKEEDKKLNVKLIDAYVYHYGWVRLPEKMRAKAYNFSRLYRNDEELAKREVQLNDFDYSGVDALNKFTGTHPKVMQARIDKINWEFDYDLSKNKFLLKHKFKLFVEKLTGYRPFEYKNYKII
ncbi:MAG: hypothetical protein ACJAWV_002135 [Flammeovirgaceae bacterium]|jgi:hypothetical protein